MLAAYRVLVHVHLEKDHIWICGAQLLKVGSDHFAGTTPRRSKVHQDLRETNITIAYFV